MSEPSQPNQSADAATAPPRESRLSVGIIAGGLLFQQAATFITGIVVARSIGSGGYGITNVLRTVFVTLITLTPLGLDLALLKHLPRRKLNSPDMWEFLGQLRLVALVLTSLTILISLFGGGQWLEAHVYHFAGFHTYLLITLLALPFATDMAIMGAYYKVIGRPATFALMNTYAQTIFRILAIFTLALFHVDVFRIVVVNSVAYVLSSVIMTAQLSFGDVRLPMASLLRSVLVPKLTVLRSSVANILKESLWMALSLFSYSTLRTVDVLVLAIYAPADQVGSYGAMSVIAQTVQVYPSAISQTLGPTIARHFQAGDLRGVKSTLDAYIRQASLIGSFVFGGIAAFGDHLDLVFGKTFRFNWLIALLVPLGWLISATLSPMGYSLSMTGRHRQELVILLCGGALLVGLNVSLVPHYGAVGAATSVIISFAAMNFVRFAYAASILGLVPGRIADILPPVLAYSTGLACKYVVDLGFHRGLPALILGCVVYSLLYVAFLFFIFASKGERRAVTDRLTAEIGKIRRRS